MFTQRLSRKLGANATWERLTNGWSIGDYWTITPSFNNYIPGVEPCPLQPAMTTRTIAAQAARRADAQILQVYTSEN